MRQLDIGSLHEAYRQGLTPAELITEVYAAIAAADDPGIFITLLPIERVLAAAGALGPFDRAAMPLWGVPFAIKDNIDLAGVPTTAACPGFAYTPAESAPVVSRLLAAGALLVGKTNLDQFATGLVGVRTPYPVPRNSIDAALVPGGSSAGSAVSVARGLVSFALGSDTAGSGRVPAALNNIVGLKPTRGLISATGAVPACRTIDCISVFAGTVPDAWTVLEAAAGYDPTDPWSRTARPGRPSLPPVVRFGVPDQKGRIFGSAEAEAAFDAAVAGLGSIGNAPLPVDMAPFFAAAALLYQGPFVAERFAAVGAFIEGSPGEVLPITRGIIEGARRYSAADAFGAQYRLAALARETAAVWETIDVLVVPSIPDVCTLADVAADPLGANARLGTYTNFVNLLDLCALAVPGPFRSDGRPAGATLIAPDGRDALLAAIAERLHAAAGVPVGATGHPLPPTSPTPAVAPGGTIEVAVVGAHLSGLALNGELTSRGATFVRAVDTEPSYRLLALPGGPPQRPGLMRVSDAGHAIAAEVWALDPAAFGTFVAAIPAPLCIGTVRLADGTAVKGFLCEGAAAEGAEDISHFGGWRAFLAATG